MKSRILIVEDNPLHMRLMEMTLRDKDYTLLKAVDGETALDMAGSEMPDLIIMDIRLPDMSGFEVTRKLRENQELNDTPIIALTAHAMNGDRDKIIKAGYDMYLSKPINTRTLPDVIRGILQKRADEAQA